MFQYITKFPYIFRELCLFGGGGGGGEGYYVMSDVDFLYCPLDFRQTNWPDRNGRNVIGYQYREAKT